jgi:YfiH family protein
MQVLVKPEFSFAEVGHGFFTRLGGVSEGLYSSLNCSYACDDKLEHVLENRKRAATALGFLPEAFAAVQCVHGADVARIQKPNQFPNLPISDAMVTNQSHIVLSQDTADCPSVLFADPINGVIGLAHAGWKSAKMDIIEACIQEMTQLGAKRESIHSVVGPCIAQDSYEVGPEFYADFLALDKAYQIFFQTNANERFQFDLRGFVNMKLTRAQIQSIHHFAVDTYPVENDFFSYRRATHQKEPDFGGHLACIYLK